MNKPLTVARQEFASSLVNVINNSELPAFAIAETLQTALVEVRKLEQLQYKKDLEAWKKAKEEAEEAKPETKSLDDITDEEREAILRHYNETIGKSIERNLNESYEDQIQ